MVLINNRIGVNIASLYRLINKDKKYLIKQFSRRKKKCLRYTEDDTACAGPNSVGGGTWSEEDADNTEDSQDTSDHCDMPMMEHRDGRNTHDTNQGSRSPHHTGISIDSDEENKSRILMHQQPPNSNGSGSSSSTNGAVPMAMMTATTSTSSSRKDSSSSSSSPQTSFLHASYHRYPIGPTGSHFPPPPHHNMYFDSFLQPTSMPLLNGLKRET